MAEQRERCWWWRLPDPPDEALPDDDNPHKEAAKAAPKGDPSFVF
jgi:hypothetical protein